MPKYTLNINDQTHSVDVDSDTPLLWVLRDHLGLLGTKFGCGMGLCGACTVHANGQAMRSCQLPVTAASNMPIKTIEGLAYDASLTPLQKAWAEMDVPQCGYCQAGQLMSASALLENNPSPTDAQIDAAMTGNICRCGTYPRIKAAIKSVSTSALAVSSTVQESEEVAKS